MTGLRGFGGSSLFGSGGVSSIGGSGHSGSIGLGLGIGFFTGLVSLGIVVGLGAGFGFTIGLGGCTGSGVGGGVSCEGVGAEAFWAAEDFDLGAAESVTSIVCGLFSAVISGFCTRFRYSQ